MTIDDKYDRVKRLMEVGKERGYVLYDEVSDVLPADINGGGDLDDVLDELNKADMKMDLDKLQQQIAGSMKSIDAEKIRLQVEKAMKDVDMDKIRKEGFHGRS